MFNSGVTAEKVETAAAEKKIEAAAISWNGAQTPARPGEHEMKPRKSGFLLLRQSSIPTCGLCCARQGKQRKTLSDH